MHVTAVLRQSEGTANFSNEAAKSLDRRGSQRRSLTLTAHTSFPVTGELQVQILDLSQGGLLLEAKAGTLSIDDQIEVELPECGPVEARVAWTSGRFVGCQFSQPVPPAAISAALLKAEPPARELTTTPDHRAASRIRLRIEPELNFSIAFMMAVVVWGLIGLAAYMTIA